MEPVESFLCGRYVRPVVVTIWGHPAVGTASPQLGLGAEQNAAGPMLPDLPSWEENLQTGFYVKYLDF